MGGKMPDMMLPITKTEEEVNALSILTGIENLRFDPTSNQPIVAETFAQAKAKAVEAIKTVTYLVIETSAGWHLRLAPVRQMEMNQVVEYDAYPRKPLDLTPEDVPPNYWTHKADSIKFTMDRFTGGFLMRGDFMAHGAAKAVQVFSNNIRNIASGALISLKLKIAGTFVRAKQHWWLHHYTYGPSYSTIKEATNMERSAYASLTRTNKGYYTMNAYARSIAALDGHTWDTLVVPAGVLDAIALNNFHTEQFRSDNAMKFLTLAGRALTNQIEGLTVMEDPKWSLDGVPQDEIESFLHYTRRGGWCYNDGDGDCNDSEDPNCRFGISYIHKGKTNWEVKKLFELLKESGRFDAKGNLHPLHWEIVENLPTYLSLARLKVYDGLLDPLMIQIAPQKYAVARTMGEVDIRYSGEERMKSHARKTKRLLLSKEGLNVNQTDIDKIEELHRLQKELNDIDEIDENLQGYVVGIAANEENYPTNGVPMLKASSTSGAPYPLHVESARNIPGGYVRPGVDRVLYFVKNNERYYIFLMRLDAVSGAPGSLARGVQGDPFVYFAARLADVPAAAENSTDNMTVGGAARFGWDRRIAATKVINYTDYYTAEGGKGAAYTGRTKVWRLWNTAEMSRAGEGGAVNFGNAGSGQGFQAPEMVQAPQKLYFYGGINGLRMMHDMYKNGQYRGWDVNDLRKAYEGVESLDAYMTKIEDIYTRHNLYFNASYVPSFMVTGDERFDRLNTSISALWGEFYRPIMVRFPIDLPDVALNRGVMVASMKDTEGDDSTTTYEQLGTKSLFDGDKLTSIIVNMASYEGRPAPYVPNVADVTALDRILKMEEVGQDIRTRLADRDNGAPIFASYRKSALGQSYALMLHKANAAAHPNMRENATIWTFFRQEVAPVFEAGRVEFEAAVSQSEKRDAITKQASAAKLFGTVVGMMLEGQTLREMTRKWIDAVKSSVSSPRTSSTVESTKKRRDRDTQMRLEVQVGEQGFAASTGARPTDFQSVRGAGDWINTRLMINKNYWNKFARRVSESGSRSEWIRLMRSVIRPMNKKDAGLALAGDIFLDLVYDPRYVFFGAGDDDSAEKTRAAISALDQYKAAAPELLSYAGTQNRSSEFFTAGEGVFEGFDVQSSKRRRSGDMDSPNSVYSKISPGLADYIADISHDVYSESTVLPPEFTLRVPTNKMTPSYMIQTQETTVDPTTGTVRYVQSLLESPWLKYRMDLAEKMSDWMERMLAKLFCFSPIHLEVYKSFLSHGVVPMGTGAMFIRPFQTDLTGAVLYAKSGKELAESGVNAPVAHLTLDGPHNVWNAYYSVWLGCVIYDPRLFMWLLGQVFRKNISGMGGDVYVGENEFNRKDATNPDKDGFVIFTGDNLRRKDIPEPVSITSHYTADRYAKTITDKRVTEDCEQHVPGIFYTICKHKLFDLNVGNWNVRGSFWDAKFSSCVNTDGFSEDHCTWNGVERKFSNLHQGQWHLSGLSPENMPFLEGTSMFKEIPLKNFTG